MRETIRKNRNVLKIVKKIGKNSTIFFNFFTMTCYFKWVSLKLKSNLGQFAHGCRHQRKHYLVTFLYPNWL